MKIDIIVVYTKRYVKGHEYDFVPPVTGVHLAAITPARHEVRLIHQQVEDPAVPGDADLVALSFFSGFAPEAYSLAARYRAAGKIVVSGGPHATFNLDETLRHFDCVVTGECESVWAKALADIEAGKFQRIYEGVPLSDLSGLPTPRYDLLPGGYFIKKVVCATRGCPYSCSFCTVPALNPGFRKRPVAEVVRDAAYDRFPHWWQRKIVWFWDDNLTIDRPYIKELLRAMIPLRKWWLTQASVDIARDEELLRLMRRSGCIGVFLGLETLGDKALDGAGKRHNRTREYRAAIKKLHSHGIAVMAGFITGFDGDSRADLERLPRDIASIGVDVPFISVLTPYRGTPLREKLESDGRILKERGWEFYNGYNVAFRPLSMTPDELLGLHRRVWNKAFSPAAAAWRVLRSLFHLRFGAFMLCLFMNFFYCLKSVRRNTPKDMAAGRIGGERHT